MVRSSESLCEVAQLAHLGDLGLTGFSLELLDRVGVDRRGLETRILRNLSRSKRNFVSSLKDIRNSYQETHAIVVLAGELEIRTKSGRFGQ